MDRLKLIKIMDMNYSGDFSGYDFFMLLISSCILENEQNPFDKNEKDALTGCAARFASSPTTPVRA